MELRSRALAATQFIRRVLLDAHGGDPGATRSALRRLLELLEPLRQLSLVDQGACFPVHLLRLYMTFKVRVVKILRRLGGIYACNCMRTWLGLVVSQMQYVRSAPPIRHQQPSATQPADCRGFARGLH